MSYSIKQYWDMLSVALDNEKRNAIKELVDDKYSDADELAYHLQRKVLSEMLMLGFEIESTNNLFVPYKKEKAEILNGLAKKILGNEEIPDIKGIKSLNFAKNVYLPHLQRLPVIKFGETAIWIAKIAGINLKERQKHSKLLIQKLQEKIDSYEAEIVRLEKLTETDKERRIEEIEDEASGLTVELNRLNHLKQNIILSQKIVDNPNVSKLPNLKLILGLDQQVGSLDVLLNQQPFSDNTKKKLLEHEKNNVILLKKFFYHPYSVLKESISQDLKELPIIEAKINDINKNLELKQEEFKRIDLSIKQEKIKNDRYKKMVSEGAFQSYKYALSHFLKTVMNKSTKKERLQVVQHNLLNDHYKSLEAIKNEINAIRNYVSAHTDKGCIGFFKFTWLRNPYSLNELNKVFDEQNNVKILTPQK